MISNIHPPGNKTGYRHPRCFASGDENCSTKISGEHTISHTLLRQVELNNTAKIAGLRWQAPETFNIVSLGSLTANVLCERHNNSLSPLDAAIGAFSLAVRECDHAFRKNSESTADIRETFSGDDIQRWMLKCIIGMAVSKNLNGSIKPECVEVLYGRAEWPTGWGLYWRTPASTPVYHSDSFAIETKVHPEHKTICLAEFVIRGLNFALCMGRPDHPEAFGTFKPGALIFRGEGREMRLILQWDKPAADHAIYLDRVGTYDGPPRDWEKWQQDG